MNLKYEAVERAVLLADHILLLTDERSDGDTFGSSLAFSFYLQGLGKRVTHYATSPLVSMHDFMPGIDTVTRDRGFLADDSIDLVILFDSSREEVATRITSQLLSSHSLVVFDHHASNGGFADVSIVDHTLSSTCEVVHRYMLDRDVSISPDMAKCLLTGVMTDTGMFENSATSAASIETASLLLSRGGSLKAVVKNIVQSSSLERLQLWGIVLSRLIHSPKHKFAITWVTREDMERTGATHVDASELSDYMMANLDVDVLMFLKEREDGIKVSLRSRTMNMLPVAEAFEGGGGHPGACGFFLSGERVVG